ncbi:pentatricopeptide repeat-containing protein At2g36240-like [Vicia villosa]|uniref:pentatricopeptide repeat-containing protein At2g36240-like n=1 Tax=Vicia villosa TaxID=3911 RepID=UPI00273B5956|nr:pentatricopeptide repeat-containing protein At2g36240-like [Vicia villosa]XP_058739050.1 pentatricopeptide repeat-containing protein At2g36240-like [Vicia villosa]XP_058739051.1 pentatricopeptide repeat-containing protein At2g36240-like [Vicia villosa]XP_058739053.1 pentatricopeptide repeat-containing protein At2g36240-like [Vicia villosa]
MKKHFLKSITKPPPPILNPPQPPPQPNPSFFPPTLSPTQHYTHFLHFLNTHLTPPLTPQTLTHFLKSKLHHHPSFTHYDFHLFNWASSLDTFSHNHTSYEWMTQTLALSHRFSLLRTLLNFISSNPCTCSHAIFSCPKTESIFRFAIHAYCKASKFDDALFAYNCMRRLIDGKPSVSICNILIHGFVKSGRFDRAFEFYNEMVRDRVKPDVFTFNILISGYCRNFKFSSALEMFDEMRKMGCHPNVVTFNTLIKGLFRERRVDEGIGMVYEMIELGCQLSNVTCEILVDGLCKEGQVSKACELLMELSKREVLPKGYDYFVLVEVLCGNGNALKALEVIYELWSKGCVPSLISCIVMIDGLRGLGKTEEAKRLVEKMLKEEGMVLDIVTFNSVLQDLCDARRTEEANRLRLLALSKGLEPDGMTYKILVIGYRGEGNRMDGELVINEMLDKGFIPDLASYNKLMDGLSNCQRPGRYHVSKTDS